tara:strand:- start:1349 stop:3211 length:1863 start_codon:yes stop_codon:yes gene_type:complete
MKRLFFLFFLSSVLEANLDWSHSNTCQFEYDSKKVEAIISNMTIEQKVGHIIMPEINSITTDEIQRYFIGTVLNGGGGFPNQDKNSSVDDWKLLSKKFYDSSLTIGNQVIPLLWGTDAVHGHNNVIGATIFPHNIGLGSTMNPDLIQEIGEAVALETLSTGIVWTFAPTIAVPQNDLWGRTYEGFSENTELVSLLGASFIKGLQGTDVNFLDSKHVLATAKHFIGDGGTFGGVDQGNTIISESNLKRIHGTPYFSALDACALSVMASFNSWNGEKSHGSKYLLTDILKNQMQFQGFIVGDWNGHGQIPGCEDANCSKAFNAGVDIFMVPTEWEPLYWNTLKQVKTGEISSERLNDAVRRILKVKDILGLLKERKPHEFEDNHIGKHHELARRAVRESIVLLKNRKSILPLNPTKKYLIVGDQSKEIINQMGGWTITWQGKTWEGVEISNKDFPNTNSIFESLSENITSSGGLVEYSSDGSFKTRPDVVIMVYGETPYAEGQGDLKDLDFKNINNNFNNYMEKLVNDNIPIVSLFISGRPLVVNEELALSDAFVQLWLPGTGVQGISDVIFSKKDGQINYDFTGKLSFSWPKNTEQKELNINSVNYDPLFNYGYGLTYSTD